MTEKCSKKDEEISHLRVQLKQVILQVLYFCEQHIVFLPYYLMFFEFIYSSKKSTVYDSDKFNR